MLEFLQLGSGKVDVKSQVLWPTYLPEPPSKVGLGCVGLQFPQDQMTRAGEVGKELGPSWGKVINHRGSGSSFLVQPGHWAGSFMDPEVCAGLLPVF